MTWIGLEDLLPGKSRESSPTRIVKMSSTALPPSQRILIVRLSAIGDVIHGVPVLCALRDALPEAFLAWVVEGRAGDLLEGHPALDELDSRASRVAQVAARSLAAAAAIARPAVRHDDRPAMPHEERDRGLALAGARRRIGKGGSDGRELSRWFHNELVPCGGTHVIEHYLDLLKPLGITAPSGAIRFARARRRRPNGGRLSAHQRVGGRQLCVDESWRRVAVEDLAGRAVR